MNSGDGGGDSEKGEVEVEERWLRLNGGLEGGGCEFEEWNWWCAVVR